MGIPENIDALLTKYDINQDCLARIADVTPGAVTGWFKGSVPRKAAIKNICEHFGLSEDDITSNRYGLAAQEHGGIYGLPRVAKNVEGMEMGYVPLRGRVHAGTPTEAENLEGLEQMVLIPQFLLDEDPECWAAESEGDCMNNVYPEGCIYVISPNKPHQNGKPEVWTIDGIDTVARRVYKTKNTLLLSPDSTNPENKDIVINADDDHYAEYDGRIVWFQSNGEVE